MNLFRSEGHVRNWNGFTSNTEEGIVQLPDLLQIFSSNLFTRRLDPDYVSHYREYAKEFMAAMAEFGKTRPFWAPEAR
jgi:hypothetical protein